MSAGLTERPLLPAATMAAVLPGVPTVLLLDQVPGESPDRGGLPAPVPLTAGDAGRIAGEGLGRMVPAAERPGLRLVPLTATAWGNVLLLLPVTMGAERAPYCAATVVLEPGAGGDPTEASKGLCRVLVLAAPPELPAIDAATALRMGLSDRAAAA
jgi:hypothetical protein